MFTAGNRARRLGVDYETDYALSTYDLETANEADAPIIEYMWKNVGNVEGLDFLVHQVRNMIYFYDASGSNTSGNVKAFTIDLSDYYVPNTLDPENQPVQMTIGKGYLFIVSQAIDPLIVEYDEMTDTIDVQAVVILIRDFDGVDDALTVEEEPTTLSTTHNYNLLNQGWTGTITTIIRAPTLWGSMIFLNPTTTTTTDVIQKYKDIIGKYPGNNKQWFLGKVEVAADGYKIGDFNPLLLNKVHVGNTRAPKGHFVFPAFAKDRSGVSGLSGLDTETSLTRPNTVCFASGRVFYGHNNNVYFSQIFSSKQKAGLCFQDNDPTSEDISDLLASDGGVIAIPSADRIYLTKEVSNGIMVFANNGVWFISGGDKGFSADDFQVTKVSSIGTDAPYSVVDTESHIYWWSRTGIQRIEQSSGVFGPISGSFKSSNLTENVIDTFIKDINSNVRKYVKGVFDYGTNTIHWLYASNDLGRNNFYNRILNFNVITESFFPWSLTSGNFPYLVGCYATSDINRISNSEPMTILGDPVVILGDPVVSNGTTISAKDTFVQFVVAAPISTGWKFTVGNFTNDNFVDWETFDTDGVTYNSFVETGYEILEDAARNKQATYVHAFFRQTEENFVADGDDYTVDKPSSCYLTTKWDWSNTTASNKWSSRVQAYRISRMPFVNVLNLAIDTGFSIVATRNKARGTGRALQFRFECDERGKNFDLLGWHVFYLGNTEE